MQVLKRAGAAIAVAVIVNLVIYFVGGAAGADYVVPQGPEQTLGELGVMPVVVVTVLSMAIGTGVYLLLCRVAPRWAWRAFLVLSALLVLVSFAPFFSPFALVNKLWLGVMHFVPPAALIIALSPTRPAHTG